MRTTIMRAAAAAAVLSLALVGCSAPDAEGDADADRQPVAEADGAAPDAEGGDETESDDSAEAEDVADESGWPAAVPMPEGTPAPILDEVEDVESEAIASVTLTTTREDVEAYHAELDAAGFTVSAGGAGEATAVYENGEYLVVVIAYTLGDTTTISVSVGEA